jgi:flagellar basal body rod protein FlgB
MNAIMKQVVAASNVGNINTPNHPMYKRLFVEVTQEQKSFHRLVLERVAIVAVIC